MAIIITPAGILGKPAGSGVSLASDQQFFDKSASTAATPAQVGSDVRTQNYSVNNNSGAVSQVLTAGQSLRFTSLYTEAAETTTGPKPDYYNTSNVAQSTYIDETNDKFLFPSNLYTYNTAYSQFIFRVILTLAHPALGSNQLSTIEIRLRREIDDSIVSSKEWNVANKGARSGFKVTRNFDTFVGDETDPYVVDGMYVDVMNSVDSDSNITIEGADIRLFRL